MANKTKINKSQLVRDILKESPKAKVAEIVAMLAAKKVKVIPAQVYFIKSKLRKGRKKRQLRQVKNAIGGSDPLSLIRKVRSLADEVGGFKGLKDLVEAIG